MTEAEKAAYTLTRQRIVSQIDRIVEKGGSPNDLKRLKRFGSAFSWYPEFYPQILADVAGMSDAELMSALRSEDKYMKLMAPVKGLPIHHKVANRTGGDIALRTPTDVFLDVRQMFYDKYGGFPGNSPWNLGAQGAIDERMHQGRYGAKGTVFDQERGLGMAPTPELPTAHGPGTKNIGLKLGQDPALLRSQAEEIFKSLDVYVGPQLDVFKQIEESPVTIGQRRIIEEAIDPQAFAEGRTTAQSTAVRKAAEASGLDVEFAKAFQYDFKGGGARLTRRAALTGLAAAGLAAPGLFGTVASAQEFAGRTQIAGETNDPADQFQAGLAGASLAGDVASYIPPLAPIGEAVSTAADVANIGIDVYRKDPEKAKQMVKQQAKRMVPADPIVTPVQRAAQAVQRGGRVKFGFGGAKFTLPELGLSELLRFN